MLTVRSKAVVLLLFTYCCSLCFCFVFVFGGGGMLGPCFVVQCFASCLAYDNFPEEESAGCFPFTKSVNIYS